MKTGSSPHQAVTSVLGEARLGSSKASSLGSPALGPVVGQVLPARTPSPDPSPSEGLGPLCPFSGKPPRTHAVIQVDMRPLFSPLTLRNSAMLEKYFWLASATFFSAACGFTISRPWSGVKATLEAVPEERSRMVDFRRTRRSVSAGSAAVSWRSSPWWPR